MPWPRCRSLPPASRANNSPVRQSEKSASCDALFLFQSAVGRGSAGGVEVVDLPLARGEAGIAVAMRLYLQHGLAEAARFVVLLPGKVDSPLGPSPRHLVRLAIAELLLLMQHPVDKGLLAVRFTLGQGWQCPEQGEQ